MQVDYEVGLDEVRLQTCSNGNQAYFQQTVFIQDIPTFLMERGHKLREQNVGESVVCGITKEENGRLLANADFRKDGGVAGF